MSYLDNTRSYYRNYAVNQSTTIAVVGAFDRFNYGDLLFPLVAKDLIQRNVKNSLISVHAAIASDLTRFGALKTESMRALYRPTALSSGDVVLFAGGGTLGADWALTQENLLNPLGSRAFYQLIRFFGRERIVKLCQKFQGGKSRFPWIAAPTDFAVPVRIAYNAVGGSQLGKLGAKDRRRILSILKKATYLSVRDLESKRQLASIESSIPIELAPDSATIMSTLYPLEYLKSIATQNILAAIGNDPYICLHANTSFANKYRQNLIELVSLLYEKTGLRVVLLPLGRYVGLDDRIGLSNLQNELNCPNTLIMHEASIFDIMLIIAQAKCYIGTSLHGMITAQSFGTPYLVLSDTNKNKVDFYLETWAPNAEQVTLILDNGFDAERARNQVEQELSITKGDRIALADSLKLKVEDNFRKLAETCGLEASNEQ